MTSSKILIKIGFPVAFVKNSGYKQLIQLNYVAKSVIRISRTDKYRRECMDKEFDGIEEAVRNTIDICIKNNMLSEYLNDNKSEVENILIDIFRQKVATEILVSKAEEEAIEEGKIKAIRKMVQIGAADIEKIKASGRYAEQEIQAIMA
jgi:hypothetical protein